MDCLESIVLQIDDLGTLASLLRVNRAMFALASQRIYRSPFKIGAKEVSNRIELPGGLVRLILANTAAEHKSIDRLCDILNIQRNPPPRRQQDRQQEEQQQEQHGQFCQQVQQRKLVPAEPFIDYLSLIRDATFPRSWNLSHGEFESRTITRYKQRYGCEYEEAKAIFFGALTWACIGHQPSLIQAVEIALMAGDELPPFETLIPQMTSLRALVFYIILPKYQGYKNFFLWYRDLTHLFKRELASCRRRGLAFLDEFRRTHGESQLRRLSLEVAYPEISHSCLRRFIPKLHELQVDFFSALLSPTGNHVGSDSDEDNNNISSSTHGSNSHHRCLVANTQGPPTPPREIHLGNWGWLWWFAHTDPTVAMATDISRLRTIRFCECDSAINDTWPIQHLPYNIMQQVRGLKTIQMYVRSGDFFRWAVLEKQQYQHHATLMPLKNALLYCDPVIFPTIVDDLLFAFGDSLEEVEVRKDFDARNGPTAMIGSDWHSPRLRKLILSSGGAMILHPAALDDCHQLEELSLDDMTKMKADDEVEENFVDMHIENNVHWKGDDGDDDDGSGEENMWGYLFHRWQMPRLRVLRLQGYSALEFCPDSLHSMTSLVTLHLRATYDIVGESVTRPDVNSNGEGYRVEKAKALLLQRTISQVANLWTWDWYLPQLQSLVIAGHWARWFDYKMLRGCPVLESLHLELIHGSAPALVDANSIYQHNCGSSLDNGVESSYAPKSDASINSKNGADASRRQALRPVPNVLPQLKYLKYLGAWQFTPENLTSLLTSDVCQHLRELDMPHAQGFTAGDLVMATRHLEDLHSVCSSVKVEPLERAQAIGLEMLKTRAYVGDGDFASQYWDWRQRPLRYKPGGHEFGFCAYKLGSHYYRIASSPRDEFGEEY
ncbi:hypothetical protein BGW41_007013 [Actinomortierella wolfii]|nr:hypothetical protein BGW41_007013 [Actinomortierella wolfii]